MAITLTKEDGSVVANANTYVEVADVDAYATNHGYSEWEGDADTKAAAILRGMNYIESYNFKGKKTARDNPLKWPRAEVRDEDDYLLESDEIPDEVVKATCEAAYREVVSPGVLQEDRTTGIKRKKVDVLETEYFQGGGGGASTVFTAIDHLLAGLIYSSFSMPVTRT